MMNPFREVIPEEPTVLATQQERQLYQGHCQGGPMAGWQQESRFPKGFLLVDKPGNRCWLYDYVPDGTSPTGGAFEVRAEEGEELVSDPEAPKNRYRAAMESEYDIVAAPWGGASNDNAST